MGSLFSKSPTTRLEGFGNGAEYQPPTEEERAAMARARTAARAPQLYQWHGTDWVASSPSTSSVTVESFTALTYNVWFGEHRFEQRCGEIMAIVQRMSPTFVAFQEATQEFSLVVMANPWVRENYIVSDKCGLTLGSYGVMIMVRKQAGVNLKQFSLHEMLTLMDRNLLCASLEINGKPFVFATVHLESLETPRTRKEQLQTIWPILATLAPQGESMLVGDFNFSDGWEEEKDLSPDYLDVWKFLRSHEAGCTMPASGQWSAWRPDRVMWRSSKEFDPCTIDILGTNIIEAICSDCSKLRRSCNPSDHFALFTKWVRSGVVSSENIP